MALLVSIQFGEEMHEQKVMRLGSVHERNADFNLDPLLACVIVNALLNSPELLFLIILGSGN